MEALLQVSGLPLTLPATCAPSESEVALAALSSKSSCPLLRHYPAAKRTFCSLWDVSYSRSPSPPLAK